MNAYRYQELAYLIIPVLLGLEFFISAKDEKKEKEETPLGSYMVFGILRVSKARAKTMERVFWVLTVFFFILENVMFIFLETVV